MEPKPKGPRISRRDFLEIGASAGGGVGLALLANSLGWLNWLQNIQVPAVPKPPVPDKKEIWNADRLEEELVKAVDESIEKERYVVVRLPPGVTHIDRKIKVDVKDANIELRGDGVSSLNLDSALSDIPKEGNSPQKNNLIEFANVKGRVVVEGITFDGGSKRAGHAGYKPPSGPWDAILYVNGTGDGSGKRPEAERDKTPKDGAVLIKNCKFYNTESAAVLTKNLAYASMSDTEGENFDALWCAAWCDKFVGKRLKGSSSPSDILAFYVCNAGELEDCVAENARQGFLFQGCRNVEAWGLHAKDCLKAYDFYQDGDLKDPCENMHFVGCSSEGAGLAYSIDYAKNISFADSEHRMIGRWYDISAFPRLTDIVEPGPFVAYPLPLYLGSTYSNVRFTNVKISKSPDTKHKYSIPIGNRNTFTQLGLTLIGFN